MKTNDEIISSFDMIQDMPVSEETLGAYLEGNLSADEMDYVGSLVQDDPMLAELTSEIIYDASPDIMPEYDGDIIYGEEEVYATVDDDSYLSVVDTDAAYMPDHDDIDINIDASDINDDTIDLYDIFSPDLPL